MAISADMARVMVNLRVSLPGAIDQSIKSELFSTLKDFFQRTNAWLEEIEFPVDPALTDYEIVPEVGVINRLMWVKSGVGRAGFRVGGTMAEPGVLVLDSPPNQPDMWTACVSLTVDAPNDNDGLPVFPAWVLDKHELGLTDGVLARMYVQPNKPYSSVAMAAVRAKSYAGTVNEAYVEAKRKNVYGGQAWAFPQSFASRRLRGR